MSSAPFARVHRMRLRRFDGQVYLDRWGIAVDFIGGIYLHRMTAPDPGLDLHDHPWAFWSLIIKGGYTEERAGIRDAPLFARIASRYDAVRHSDDVDVTHRGTKEDRRPGSIKAMRLDECHRITELHGPVCWTLVIRGPRRRGWGFYMPDGYVPEAVYDATVRAERRDLWSEGGNVERLIAEADRTEP